MSNIFGSSAIADSENQELGQGIDKNSQNMDLLEANFSFLSVLNEENNKSTKSEDVKNIPEDGSVNILSDNALLPTANRIDMPEASNGEDLLSDTSIYVVRKGDSLAQIAEMFDVSVNTILWANDMKKGDPLVEGETLLILPVSGIKHTVEKGQTLKGLANKYKVDINDIAGFNGIAVDAALAVGDELIIPDAEMTLSLENPKPNPSGNKFIVQKPLKDTKGYFTYPTVSWARRSRGIQKRPKHNGVDLAAPIGTPIYAAASGTVIIARPSGYNGGYGKMVMVQHPNGTQTIYGHLSAVNVSRGQQVLKGQVIAQMGNTGRSTGPHLHFEVKGGKNPF